MTATYTFDEVARHNNPEDMWIVIHDAIYDVSEFHKVHPGGEDALIQVAGQDATNFFYSVGHTEEAINLRRDFKIGNLVKSADFGNSKTTEVNEPMKKQEESKAGGPKTENPKASNLTTFISVAAIFYAIIMFYWFLI